MSSKLNRHPQKQTSANPMHEDARIVEEIPYQPTDKKSSGNACFVLFVFILLWF